MILSVLHVIPLLLPLLGKLGIFPLFPNIRDILPKMVIFPYYSQISVYSGIFVEITVKPQDNGNIIPITCIFPIIAIIPYNVYYTLEH